jgi:ribosome-binding protein aMBF1 (putative translation factor)
MQHKPNFSVKDMYDEDDEHQVEMEKVTHVLSEAIQQARAKKEWTQAQLAKAINEKTGVVVEYENGSAVYNNEVANKMEKALGVHLPRGRAKKKGKKPAAGGMH